MAADSSKEGEVLNQDLDDSLCEENMADSSGEGEVSKQDLDDSLCEEDSSQTQMPVALLKFYNISNNSNDGKKYGSNSISEDEDLQIRAPPDACRFPIDSTSVHLHDNDSIQRSPFILLNPHPSTQVINIQKKKPIFGKKYKSHSSPKYRVAKNAPAASDNNDGSNLSSANARKIPCGKPKKLRGRVTTKDESKIKTLTKSTKELTSDGEKPTKKSASKKLTVTESTLEKKTIAVGKPKNKVSIKGEEKASKCEPKKQKKKNRDREQKMIGRKRKREENQHLKEEKKLKSQLLKHLCDQKKDELEHEKREKMFSREQIDNDELKTTFTVQRTKVGQAKVNALKKNSIKQPDDALEVNQTPILEEEDDSSLHSLEFQDPVEVAISISSPESPPSGLSNVLSKDTGSLTHNAHLDFKNSIACNDAVFPAVHNLKQLLPEDALSAAPVPKRAKLNSNVAGTGFEMRNYLVSPGPKERNKMTKFDAGSRPFPKKTKTKMHMEANMTGPVWVKCCNTWCQKWRQLKDHFDPLTVPTFWNCTENSDANCNDCSIPMEQWDDYENDEFQFVESAYVPGSLVWAKLGSYPWYITVRAVI